MDFSMVSNEILRDKSISLKAKGLYALIQSYVTLDKFNLYKKYLVTQSKDGKKSFESAWKELKETGYLIQYRMKDEKNHFYYEYELLDTPKSPVPQNGIPEDFPVPLFGDTTNRMLSKTDVTQKGGDINNIIKNNTIKNNIISNHILSEEDVKQMIGYDNFSQSDKKTVDEIVLLLTEIFGIDDSEIIRVNSRNMAAKTVKERLSKLTFDHIVYVLMVLEQFDGTIGNMRSYMVTTLFNAPATMESYYRNLYNKNNS
jgi:hypothetical protein